MHLSGKGSQGATRLLVAQQTGTVHVKSASLLRSHSHGFCMTSFRDKLCLEAQFQIKVVMFGNHLLQCFPLETQVLILGKKPKPVTTQGSNASQLH